MSKAHNFFNIAAIKKMEVPATKTGTVTSTFPIDVRGYDGCGFIVFAGASGDTLSLTVKFQAKLTECATELGTFTDVADDDVESATDGQTNAFALIDASGEDSNLYMLSYMGSLNWVKVVVTFTGTHTYGIPLCIFAGLELPLAKATENIANP
jgi:hypothetical protein